ncbi:diguanylate cyclase (GGDEF) domain-containing protein [Quadrisphaera granulorum]|uniref:Diguanylate cyclase (GGDEF)-like protein n=1 Tax=Quadrisphaera granulorum TaxID=317664 RepID=A0A315ZS74_9ACTN|nr:GGDEF domain-containing protein [Quadrisphaera granulorum]PWJ47983.1 diguanylate cyclase (GGDEF)-like protein [Quadrisphaera granulorum]SZE98555.1 diguanylate cyclase (GGDEF) domain-containing protein [Quadrisphaera granulorum]
MARLVPSLSGPDVGTWSAAATLGYQAYTVLAVHAVHLLVIWLTGAPARVDVILASAGVWVVLLVWVKTRGTRLRDGEVAGLCSTGAVIAVVNGLFAQPPTHVAFIAVGLVGMLLSTCSFTSLAVARVVLPVVLVGQVMLQLGTFGTSVTSLAVAGFTVAATLGACQLVLSAKAALDEALARADQAARTDPLTGLLNRRALAQAFGAVRAAAPGGHRAAVVALDLDHFKRINDEHGHDAGDDVLRRVADVMRAHTRQGDLLVRLGGEELAWVGSWADAEEAHASADRLRAAVAAAPSQGIPVTTSAGVAFSTDATHAAPDAEALSRLLVRADVALYEAKRAGRDRVVLAAPQLPTDADPHHGNDGTDDRASTHDRAPAPQVRDGGSGKPSAAAAAGTAEIAGQRA